MKKINKTQQIVAIALLAVILAGSAYAYFFSHINVLHAELQTIRKEIAILDSAIQNEHETQSLLEQTLDARTELSGRFVPIEDPTVFLETIEDSAESAGVTLEIEKVQTKELNKDSNNPQKALALTLIVNGGWNEMYRLLSLLETMPYATTITTASVLLEENNGVPNWKGQIQLQSLAL